MTFIFDQVKIYKASGMNDRRELSNNIQFWGSLYESMVFSILLRNVLEN